MPRSDRSGDARTAARDRHRAAGGPVHPERAQPDHHRLRRRQDVRRLRRRHRRLPRRHPAVLDANGNPIINPATGEPYTASHAQLLHVRGHGRPGHELPGDVGLDHVDQGPRRHDPDDLRAERPGDRLQRRPVRALRLVDLRPVAALDRHLHRGGGLRSTRPTRRSTIPARRTTTRPRTTTPSTASTSCSCTRSRPTTPCSPPA